MLDYHKTRNWISPGIRHVYGHRDTAIYALGLGFAEDPLDEKELRYVYEKDMRVVPTMASVMGSPGFWMRDEKQLGIDVTKLVHGEQSLYVHSEMPAAGVVIGTTRVKRVVDKGEGKGALLTVEKTVTDESGKYTYATVESAYFLRGDGGFSKGHGESDQAGPSLPATPEIAPEMAQDMPTRANAALLYRLSGDINPLHVEAELATKVGFAKPILHGLASYGLACHALLKGYCEMDSSRIKSLNVRLSSPVYPGETIRIESWKLGGEIAFRGRVIERDVVVLSHGRAQLA